VTQFLREEHGDVPKGEANDPQSFLLAILIIGVLLIVAPFAISLPSKASAGQAMLDNFHPIMQPASVKQTVSLYENTFLKLKPVASGGIGGGRRDCVIERSRHRTAPLAPQLEQYLGGQFPLSLSCWRVSRNWSGLLPGGSGLADYKPLVDTMQANVSNYQQVDSLPNFRLFTWFFEVPGILIAVLPLGLGVGWRQRQVSPSP